MPRSGRDDGARRLALPSTAVLTSFFFGLIHVDYATMRRTPKLSASFYREVIARNAVV